MSVEQKTILFFDSIVFEFLKVLRDGTESGDFNIYFQRIREEIKENKQALVVTTSAVRRNGPIRSIEI